MAVILKAPLELCCQKALLSCELSSIFENSPITQDLLFDFAEDSHPGVRKAVDGDCPVCVLEFEDGEDLVWCKAACGQNVHADCFDQYKKSQASSYSPLRCVYCRSDWVEDMVDSGSYAEAIKRDAPKVGHYKNIGHIDMYTTTSPG